MSTGFEHRILVRGGIWKSSLKKGTELREKDFVLVPTPSPLRPVSFGVRSPNKLLNIFYNISLSCSNFFDPPTSHGQDSSLTCIANTTLILSLVRWAISVIQSHLQASLLNLNSHRHLGTLTKIIEIGFIYTLVYSAKSEIEAIPMANLMYMEVERILVNNKQPSPHYTLVR